jgi:AraC-like DNA-binding protein
MGMLQTVWTQGPYDATRVRDQRTFFWRARDILPGHMDPIFRRWWRLIDDLPGKVTQVTLWNDGPSPPLTGDGHLHVTPTSVVCLDGVVRIVAPGKSLDLQPGHVLIIGAGVWHRHEALRRGSIWFGQGFLPACSDVLIGDQDREWRGRLPSEPSRRLMDATMTASNDHMRCASFAELVKQILSESVDDLPFTNPALQRMIARLWSNLHRGVTVEDLIHASALSRAQAYRIFTEGYGVPPKDAIATARLWLAQGLLNNGLSVAAVADRCGFPSADTFARSWKRTYGSPPSKERK